MSRAARPLGVFAAAVMFPLRARDASHTSALSRLGLLGEHLRDHRARLGAREGHGVPATARRVDDEERHAADAPPRPAPRFRLHLPHVLLSRVRARVRTAARARSSSLALYTCESISAPAAAPSRPLALAHATSSARCDRSLPSSKYALKSASIRPSCRCGGRSSMPTRPAKIKCSPTRKCRA